VTGQQSLGTGLWTRVRALRDGPVVAAASHLFGSTVITSVLGFAFWALAARFYSPVDVGVSSAAISAMQFLAMVGVLGLNTLVIGEIRQHSNRAGLLTAAGIVATVASSLAALVYVLVAPLIQAHLGPLGQGVGGAFLFVAGVGLTGLTIVIDQSFIGLLRGEIQLWRNGVFATVKLLLLPLGILFPSVAGAVVIYGVWFLANVVSLFSLLLHARRQKLRPRFRPHWRALRALRGAALAHHWLNLASYGPRLILPIIVASMLGPALNAAFYTALLVVTFVNVIPGHLSTALFSLGRGDMAGLARESRRTLSLSAAVAVGSGVLFVPLSHPILRIISSDYVIATSSMILLGLTTLPLAVKLHYIAVNRVLGRLKTCAAVITACGVFQLVLAGVGAQIAGLVGVSTGYLVALAIEAVVLWPSVARAINLPVALVRLRRN
jgi:O-antigen/teichoic acid export membrane protein